MSYETLVAPAIQAGAFTLVAWLVRRVFTHTIPRLASENKEALLQQQVCFSSALSSQIKENKDQMEKERDMFREELRRQREDFIAESKESRDSFVQLLREERTYSMTHVDRLSKNVENLVNTLKAE